jgi:hypothetical protein
MEINIQELYIYIYIYSVNVLRFQLLNRFLFLLLNIFMLSVASPLSLVSVLIS